MKPVAPQCGDDVAWGTQKDDRRLGAIGTEAGFDVGELVEVRKHFVECLGR